MGQLQNAGQDPDGRIKAIYACLREEQRLEEQFIKFDVEQREGTREFTLFPKPSPAQLQEAKQEFHSLRAQLNPVRELQERLLGSYHNKMAKVQEMPDGPKRQLNIDIVWNLALAERMEPTVKSEEKQNSADIADYRLGRPNLHGSRFYELLEGSKENQAPDVQDRSNQTDSPVKKALKKLKSAEPRKEGRETGVRIVLP